jgi:hypothetical protein
MTMWRVQYRNFGGVQTMVSNFTVDATGNNLSAPRWFVLSKVGRSNWFTALQGTYSPDADSTDPTHRWMGSASMDGCGNLAVGYSVSNSDTVFPGLRYAGRKLLDPPGQLPRGENVIVAGETSQDGFNRWGDYSGMTVDPVDDATFWYTSEYMGADGNAHTRIASFKFPGCGQ